MTFQPIAREQFSVTPFWTYKAHSLTQASSGVNAVYAYSGAAGITGSIYGTIKNMYGTGCETVFGQKNLTLPKYSPIIGISSEIYGNEIAPGSFSLVDYYFSPTVITLIDDGHGNLYDNVLWQTGRKGYYEFNGSGSSNYLTGSCPNCTVSVEDFMVEFYLKAYANATESGIITRRLGLTTGFEIHLLGLTTHAAFSLYDIAGNVSANINTSLSVADGLHHHFVGIFDRSHNATFYMDGSSGSVTGINIAPVSASISAAGVLGIGVRFNASLTSSLSGNISTFRFYNFGSGGLLSNIEECAKYNYLSASIHHDLGPYLIENWDWQSGSNRTGSVSGNILENYLDSASYRSNQPVGNIFYSQGFVVITETVYNNRPYRYIGSGGAGCNIYLKSKVKRNEIKVECFSPAGAQNSTTNPTALWGTNSYVHGMNVTGAGTSAYEYRNYPTTPYVTTIGAYNDEGQLLMVGKLAQPIPKKDMDVTYILSLDL